MSQVVWACGFSRIDLVFFHATDAPNHGRVSRVDRLAFVSPALLAILLGLRALRAGGPWSRRALAGLGVLFGIGWLGLMSLAAF